MQVPPLKLTLGNTEGAEYCGGNVTLGITEEPVAIDGVYSLFDIPIERFGCTGKHQTPSLAQVDALGIQNAFNQTTITFCVDDIVINQE